MGVSGRRFDGVASRGSLLGSRGLELRDQQVILCGFVGWVELTRFFVVGF